MPQPSETESSSVVAKIICRQNTAGSYGLAGIKRLSPMSDFVPGICRCRHCQLKTPTKDAPVQYGLKLIRHQCALDSVLLLEF